MVMFDGFPQELLYYFNVNEIFVEFLETEFIDQNGNKKVLDKLAKVLRNFLIDFEPHSSRINIQALLNKHSSFVKFRTISNVNTS